jgi:hypothetical protein
MKTLTLIIATGALLAAGAPIAGAKNTLQCSVSAKHSTVVHIAGSSSGTYGYQIQRNLASAGSKSCGAATSTKAHKSGNKAQPKTPLPVIQPAVQVTPVPSLAACADAQTGDDYVELGVQSCPDPATAAPDDSSVAASASEVAPAIVADGSFIGS